MTLIAHGLRERSDPVRTGFVLPLVGSVATTQAIVQIAQRAETSGYDSVWVTEPLFCPPNPQASRSPTSDGSSPEAHRTAFDPIGVLAFVASQTKRIALGTSALNIAYYNPVMLSRQLTTLDVLSGGRLRVGLGQDWSKNEYDAGIAPRTLGTQADEFIQVLKAFWTTDPVEFHGRYFNVPRSSIQPKPFQKPHPPLYLTAYFPEGLERTATLSNGWNLGGVRPEGIRQTIASLTEMAKAAGRETASLEVVVRAKVLIAQQPFGKERFAYLRHSGGNKN